MRIERQHSQEMALRALKDYDPDASAENYKDAIAEWTDHFCDDLDDYERARKGQPPKAREYQPENTNLPDGSDLDVERPPLSDDDAPPF